MIDNNDIFLDFETRSRAKLSGKDGVGAWRYSLDPSTKVLCLAYAFGEDEPNIWIEGQPPPRVLMGAIEAGKRVHGWNSMSMERAIFHNICVPKLGWIEPKPEQYYDTMLDALTLALPAKLEHCCHALKTTNVKMEEGAALITRLCKPISSGKLKGQFREREQFVAEYAQLYLYCKQDVRTERDIFKQLPYHLTGKERQFALMIMRMNERGLPIDVGLVESIVEALAQESVLLQEEFYSLTGVAKPTERAQFQAWLEGQGVVLPNMQAATLAELDVTKLPTRVQMALSVYDDSNNASTAKFSKILQMLCPDGTVKNNLIFNKANTGRLAGAGFQAQNLPRASSDTPEAIINCFIDRDYEFLRLYCGIQNAAKMMVRASIRAPAYKKFISGDLKGIEARGSGWVAGEWGVLNNFRAGIDAYVSSAAGMYNTIVDMVTKEQRQSGKVAVLSGGFGGGYKALMKMARTHGMHLTIPEAKKIIRDFRRGRPLLVQMWANFGEAAMQAVRNGGMVFVEGTRNTISFELKGQYLFMKLPSGRRLSFPFPEIRLEPFFGKMQENVTAMWVDSTPGGNHKWTRRTITGANFFQSAVQASCRDILFDGHMVVEEEGYPLVLSVHDEGLSLVPDDPSFNIQEYSKLMSVVPKWCPEMPIESDCWEGYRYRK